jgi:hypothetical protein
MAVHDRIRFLLARWIVSTPVSDSQSIFAPGHHRAPADSCRLSLLSRPGSDPGVVDDFRERGLIHLTHSLALVLPRGIVGKPLDEMPLHRIALPAIEALASDNSSQSGEAYEYRRPFHNRGEPNTWLKSVSPGADNTAKYPLAASKRFVPGMEWSPIITCTANADGVLKHGIRDAILITKFAPRDGNPLDHHQGCCKVGNKVSKVGIKQNLSL